MPENLSVALSFESEKIVAAKSFIIYGAGICPFKHKLD